MLNYTMSTERSIAGLYATISLLNWLSGRRVVRLGVLPPESDAARPFVDADLALFVIETHEPLQSMYGSPSLPHWLAQLQGLTEPIDLLWIDSQPVERPRFKELLDGIPAAVAKLSARSMILVEDEGQDGSRKVGQTVKAAESCGFGVLFSADQTLLVSAAVREIAAEIPRLPVPLFHELTLDDGVRLQQRGALWQAQRIYERLLAENGDDASAMHLLGLVHHQRGNQELAGRLIRDAILRRPTSAILHNNYGAVHLASGNLVEALGSFCAAVALRPGYADALSNLGNVWERLGRVSAAESYYRRALEIEPNHVDSLRRLNSLLSRRGQREPATQLFQEIP
jgi:tetratricopeptide (TPR) repeat protein